MTFHGVATFLLELHILKHGLYIFCSSLFVCWFALAEGIAIIIMLNFRYLFHFAQQCLNFCTWQDRHCLLLLFFSLTFVTFTDKRGQNNN